MNTHGRWIDTEKVTDYICNLCKRDFGAEFYYILCCAMLKNEREMYIPMFYSLDQILSNFVFYPYELIKQIM